MFDSFEFKRVFPFVWKQWPKLATIVLCALINAFLFSATIAAIVPLLKVMMGQEGLHGWVDRNLTSERYGMSFYIPDKQDLASDPNLNNYLRVISVKGKGAAAMAGIRANDMITAVAVDSNAAVTGTSAQFYAKLAAVTTSNEITLAISRPKLGALESHQLHLKPAKAPIYAPYALHALSYIPRTANSNKEKAILFLMIALTIATGIRCFCRFAQDYLGQTIVATAIADIRELAFGHALNMPVGYFAKEGASDTVSRLVQDTSTIGGGIKTVITKAVRETLTAFTMLGWALFIDPKITLVFLCSAPMVVIAITNFGRKIKKATKKSLANWAKILCKLEESILAIKIVKIYNRQASEESRFKSLNRQLLKQQFRVAKVDAATDPTMEFLGMIALSGGIVFGAKWAMSASGDPTTFFGVLILLGSAANAIRRASDVANRLNQSNAAAERTFAIIDQPTEDQLASGHELIEFKKSIDFKNVVFTYPGTERAVLKGIDLSIKAGQNIAIVGPNGSGKTTLVNLLPRFYNPDKGTIHIDGYDISAVTLHSLRNQMAMVTQNVLTFNDTIAANIAYGKPGATMDEIIQAAKRSYAHEFIEPLPDGYNTIIGEQGSGLSGGQLQRLVIARAILKNPPIMIFDEAMSQIDADSEAKIHSALNEFMKNRTSFVIAHRFSTVINADMIVVVNDGQIIATGVHSELVKTCPIYQSLYQTQLLKE